MLLRRGSQFRPDWHNPNWSARPGSPQGGAGDEVEGSSKYSADALSAAPGRDDADENPGGTPAQRPQRREAGFPRGTSGLPSKGDTAMCGIMGYVGGQEAAPIIIDGLHRLEYRGYDSARTAGPHRPAPPP